MTAGFSPALERWAERQGQRLAESFIAADICHDNPSAHFEKIAADFTLLRALRAHAEPAFLERVTELEAGAA